MRSCATAKLHQEAMSDGYWADVKGDPRLLAEALQYPGDVGTLHDLIVCAANEKQTSLVMSDSSSLSFIWWPLTLYRKKRMN